MPEHANPKLRHASNLTGTTVQPAEHAYAELAVTSNFSFLRGASHPDELVVQAAHLGYQAIGITDINSVAGAVRMHMAAKEVGLKLIVGCRLVFSNHPPILVWPTDRAAYGRLCQLLTLGKRRTTKGECDLSLHDLLDHQRGLLAAVIAPQTIDDSFGQQLETLKEVMGPRLSVAASCNFETDNQTRLCNLNGYSRAHGIPLLATNDAHYHHPDRRRLQDVLTCIRHGCAIQQAGYRLFQNAERYLKSPAQMHRLFADYPQAITRGIELAEQCEFNLDQLRYEYPHELISPGKTQLQHLTDLTWIGAANRYPQGIPDKVKKLVEKELKLIGELQIEAYFLTVEDLVRFARARGILCQGRGSAANSAVCYCIGVTSVDPDRIEVLFERFVSAARNEPPDIDVDFEHERREEVIQYVYEKYGRDRAGMTAEVITYRGRSAVRDVGKALGLGLDTLDQMASRLDWWDRGTLTPEKLQEVGLNPADRTIATVVDLSGQLLGFPRHLGQHVGGMVMTSGLLCELVPVENASMPNRTVIEWDKQDIDDLKILKVDILALGMLTCIAKCIALINNQPKPGLRQEEFTTEARRHGEERNETTDAHRRTQISQNNFFIGVNPCASVVPKSPNAFSVSPCLRGESSPAPKPGLRYSEGPDLSLKEKKELTTEARRHGEERNETTDAHRCTQINQNNFFIGVNPCASVVPKSPNAFSMSPCLRGESSSDPLQLHTIPPEDPLVYEMISDADTIGVFQIESRAQMSMLPRLKPSKFYDLVIEVAIVRPGPIQGEMVHPYLRRRNGLEPVTYPSKELEAVLSRTLGVPLFQEQAMSIAMKGAGLTGAEADRFRRAMAAWKRGGAIEEFRKKILAGMHARGYDPKYAEQCFDMLKGFGEYGFPESHSASFALLVYISSWIKRNHPAIFCCGLLNSQPMGFYAPAQIVRDAQAHGVTVLPVDVNHSEWDCTIVPTSPKPGLRYPEGPDLPLKEKKEFTTEARRHGEERSETTDAHRCTQISQNNVFIGVNRSSSVVPNSSPAFSVSPCLRGESSSAPQERKDNEQLINEIRKKWDWGTDGPAVRLGLRMVRGLHRAHADCIINHRNEKPFISIDNFARRTALPSHSLRRLAEADAFQSLGLSRRQALWEIMKCHNQPLPLFDWLDEDSQIEPAVKLPTMPITQEVNTDYRTVSLSLKRHPVALIREQLNKRRITPAAELVNIRHGTWVKVAGLVLIRQRPGTASGIVFETLEDETGIANLIIRPAIYERYRRAARHSTLVQADGYVERQDKVVHVMAMRMTDLSAMIQDAGIRSRDFH